MKPLSTLTSDERVIVDKFVSLRKVHIEAFSDGWSSPKGADAWMLADIANANLSIARGVSVSAAATKLAARILAREYGQQRVRLVLTRFLIEEQNGKSET